MCYLPSDIYSPCFVWSPYKHTGYSQYSWQNVWMGSSCKSAFIHYIILSDLEICIFSLVLGLLLLWQNTTTKANGDERVVWLTLPHVLQHWRNWGQGPLTGQEPGDELTQRLWREAAYQLALRGLPHLLCYSTQDTSPGVAVCGWCPPSLISN